MLGNSGVLIVSFSKEFLNLTTFELSRRFFCAYSFEKKDFMNQSI